MSAFLFVEDNFFTPYFSANSSLDIFKELETEFPDSIDVSFGSAMSFMYKPLFFEDNFFVSSLYIEKGDFVKGIKMLDSISFNGNIAKVEANLVLIDYYSNLLQDYNTSIKYTGNLVELYKKNSYFTFLHAKNLFYLEKYDSAIKLFTSINNNIPSTFYPYHYSSLIFEAKSSLNLKKLDRAIEVVKLALSIHESKSVLQLKDKIELSIKNGDSNIQKTKQSYSTSDSLYNEHILLFKKYLMAKEYSKAELIYQNKIEIGLDEYFDRRRIKLLHNVIINNL